MGKVIIFAAPSGSGKSTIISSILKEFKELEFSISATSRSPRGEEKNGVEYYFLTSEEFREKADRGMFIEWEEVYSGSCYGTLSSEVERIWAKKGVVVFDIDVKGAINIKKRFGNDALSIFIMPPSINELRRRLEMRATDSNEAIEKRVSKAQEEISYSDQFDKIVLNDMLPLAIEECRNIIKEFTRC
ncbi:MAG: guanylate kinase [Rikenellaceae bacterium]